MSRRLACIIFAIAVLAISLFALAGCGGTTPTTVSDTAPPTTLPIVEYLDPQPVDLEAISNLANADLTDAEKQMLAQQSFVAVSPTADEASWKFWMIYENARYLGLPVLITTDSMLNAYHGMFDTLMQRAEESALYDQALVMTQELYESSRAQWLAANDPTIKAEARLNMAYFAIAAALLDPTASVPGEVQTEVQAEVALISAARRPG